MQAALRINCLDVQFRLFTVFSPFPRSSICRRPTRSFESFTTSTMVPATTLLVLAAAASSAFAGHNHARHAELARRQAHIERSLIDVCAALDLDLQLLDILPGGKPLITGHIDVCLCLSVLPGFVKSDPACQAAAQHIGHEGVLGMLQDHMNNATSKQQCTYPPHAQAKATCDSSDPCGSWECSDGYKKSGDQCVCAAPSTECNGHCGSFPNGCGSATPKRRNAKSAPFCEDGLTLCGIPGSPQAKKRYECIDTQTDLETCGGCIVSSPFSTLAADAPIGKDCSAIAHAEDVLCQAGECVVNACETGFELSPAGDACVAA
ncbi:hypothetical protein PENSPDRAFT_753248 [Peniophora sp. CONT]|nr:hypothetical protein PENSPDRAFT_753248 [Peniophora sp. CONT]